MAFSTSVGVLDGTAEGLASAESAVRSPEGSAAAGLDGRTTTLEERAGDILARVLSGVFFVLLSIDLIRDYLRTQHVTGLLLLLSEALVVMLIVFRRPARRVDRSTLARVVTAVSLAGPPLLRAGGASLLPDVVTALVSSVGIVLVIASKATLGRSFGLVPANRGVVVRGPYRLMRHPIYAGYLISHVGFLCAHPTPVNIALLVIADTALIYRALLEERTLLDDARYREYAGQVGWHLVPGLF